MSWSQLVRHSRLGAATLAFASLAGPAPAAPISVSFSGVIDFLADPGGIVDPSIGVGDSFSGSYTLDPDDAVLRGTDGVNFIYEVVGSGNSASVLLEGFLFENTTGSTGPFQFIDLDGSGFHEVAASVGSNPAVIVRNDSTPEFWPDAWSVILISNASAIAAPLPGPGAIPADAQICGFIFGEAAGTHLGSGDFFVSASLGEWDGGAFACFERDNLATPLFSGTITTVVPEPETGAMLMLGLVLLAGLRWRRS